MKKNNTGCLVCLSSMATVQKGVVSWVNK